MILPFSSDFTLEQLARPVQVLQGRALLPGLFAGLPPPGPAADE